MESNAGLAGIAKRLQPDAHLGCGQSASLVQAKHIHGGDVLEGRNACQYCIVILGHVIRTNCHSYLKSQWECHGHGCNKDGQRGQQCLQTITGAAPNLCWNAARVDQPLSRHAYASSVRRRWERVCLNPGIANMQACPMPWAEYASTQ